MLYQHLVQFVAQHELPYDLPTPDPSTMADRAPTDPAIHRETLVHLTAHYILVLLGFAGVSESAKADMLHMDRLNALTVLDFEHAFVIAADHVDAWRPDDVELIPL
jgi:hypothetical protein